MFTAPRQQVFVSYHHANDQAYRDRFESIFAQQHEIIVPRSVQIGDINPNLNTETVRQKIRDEYLRDSTVTVVLIGRETWKRKHVDWEISATIRDTRMNPRGGLLGILLPTYPRSQFPYNPRTVPPRLHDNIACGFAKIYEWSENPGEVACWIDAAFERQKVVNPNNSYSHFANNRSGDQWQ